MNKFPNRIFASFNVRLGLPPEELRKRYPDIPESHFKVWMPTADAIVVTKERIYVVEAKIRNPRNALGQLVDYARRLPNTPELKRFFPREIVKLLVIPLEDPELIMTARELGINIDVYRPDWVIDYLREVKLIP